MKSMESKERSSWSMTSCRRNRRRRRRRKMTSMHLRWTTMLHLEMRNSWEQIHLTPEVILMITIGVPLLIKHLVKEEVH